MCCQENLEYYTNPYIHKLPENMGWNVILWYVSISNTINTSGGFEQVQPSANVGDLKV